MAFNLEIKILAILLIFMPRVLAASKISTGSGRISRYIAIPGKVVTNPNKTAHVSPRYDGVVKKVHFRAGDIVRKRTILATVEQNNVVSRYNIVSPISGIILHRYINPGEFVNQDQMAFQISDVKTVWINFEVRPQNIGHFKKGKKITIKSRIRGEETSGNLFYISPVVDGTTRTIRVSVEIPNKDGIWAPGKIVEGYYFEKMVDIPHVIPVSHLQKDDEKNFVFVKKGESFKKVAVRIGRRDDHFAEVLAGISVGSTISDKPPEDSHNSLGKNEEGHEEEGHEEEGHESGEHREHDH